MSPFSRGASESESFRESAWSEKRVMTERPILEVDGISLSFGAVSALNNVTLQIQQEELCGLIGPNGAGKTTLFNVIAGFLHTKSGRLRVDGRTIKRARAHDRPKMGIRRTFQGVELFDDLSVIENVTVASSHGNQKEIDEVLDDFELGDFKSEMVRELPAGMRRKVGVARALVGRPRLVLMDEPGAGLVAHETESLGRMIRQACVKRGSALLLVDHDMSLIRIVSERLFVLDFGELIASGTPEEIERDKKVRTAYLGT